MVKRLVRELYFLIIQQIKFDLTYHLTDLNDAYCYTNHGTYLPYASYDKFTYTSQKSLKCRLQVMSYLYFMTTVSIKFAIDLYKIKSQTAKCRTSRTGSERLTTTVQIR